LNEKKVLLWNLPLQICSGQALSVVEGKHIPREQEERREIITKKYPLWGRRTPLIFTRVEIAM